MRVILLCAGAGERWNDYRGVPKHLVKLCGEPVLTRTIRLLAELAPGAEVVVVVENLRDRRYLAAVKAAGNPNARRTEHKPRPDLWGDLDKIVEGLELMARSGASVVLMGDVWWSRPALADVIATAEHYENDVPWTNAVRTFMRVGPDGLGGELFGFVLPASSHDFAHDRLVAALDAYAAGDLEHAGYGAPLRGGWAFYRAVHGAPWDAAGPLGEVGATTIVDDWTDDMDSPEDWDRWCYRWAKASPAERAAQV